MLKYWHLCTLDIKYDILIYSAFIEELITAMDKSYPMYFAEIHNSYFDSMDSANNRNDVNQLRLLEALSSNSYITPPFIDKYWEKMFCILKTYIITTNNISRYLVRNINYNIFNNPNFSLDYELLKLSAKPNNIKHVNISDVRVMYCISSNCNLSERYIDMFCENNCINYEELSINLFTYDKDYNNMLKKRLENARCIFVYMRRVVHLDEYIIEESANKRIRLEKN